jgi:light-regulated signal transduction histidine kinase (bacteriophytochrome)
LINCSTLGVVRHLAHELRQPLSGIESIAYYLEMVLPDADDVVRDQFEKLRQMIQHANWILQDSVQAARVSAPSPSRLDLKRLVGRITAEIVAREEQHLLLYLDETLPEILFDEAQARAALQNLLDFFRVIAQTDDPVRIQVEAAPSGAIIRVSAASGRIDVNTFYRLLDPRRLCHPDDGDLPVGSVRQLMEVNGGSLRLSSAPEGRLTAEMFFPAA